MLAFEDKQVVRQRFVSDERLLTTGRADRAGTQAIEALKLPIKVVDRMVGC